MQLTVPQLQTPRLILRGPEENDFETVACYMASPRSKFTGGPTQSRFDAWRGFLGVIGHWALRGYGFFTVTLRDGTRIGRVGILNHDSWPEPELGWHLFDGFEGHGYATEAAAKARDWAKKSCGLGPLVSFVHPDNDKSRFVAQRLGAHLESRSTLFDHPVEIWRHVDPQP